MYKFPYFKEDDEKKVTTFMQLNPFVIITGSAEGLPVATHIPVDTRIEADGKLTLHGHMMRKTDHHQAFEKNNEVLVIYNGPHCYVSASWYQDPHSGSTWNYMTVHARGRIFFTDAEGTYQAVKWITDKYEGTETAASFKNLSEDYVSMMVKAIVGFRIEVEQIENVFKLSQNKDEASRKNIIQKLKERGDGHSRSIAEEMMKRI